ncbi:MAG: hypothetical protein GDA40_12525 [Rhodobacteraceae bacterium]|nr:hypothetical protein [Paracoccaceae bacterium]
MTDVEAAGDSDVRRFGAWMDHAGFYLYTGVPVSGDDLFSDYTFIVADSFGDASGNRPSADATYEGAMVGSPWGIYDDYGDVLVGDAALGYTAGTGAVTLEFTNIFNVDKGVAYARMPNISFGGLNPVAGSDGAITSNNSSRGLSAHFYGPNQEEVAGRFNHQSVNGAFGVKRQ